MYLGHIISVEGVVVDPSKISPIQYWALPTTVKKLHGSLGLASYYCKFVAPFASIAAPFTDLLHKDVLLWTEQATTAFAALK
ncbi:hypothetical protein Syun_021180 [Stephania yunnanensis]|uniref:Reverse transcriptase/retrotransposon-derived protein RNase H-like domain-containing protein n=1 Tax=Stephania yunnanensis TaxID=152371 RepID=A0AAP0NPJ3_9MAGN